MPIEVKELHIKINVEDQPQSSDPIQNGEDGKDEIIAACVEQVLGILSKKQER